MARSSQTTPPLLGGPRWLATLKVTLLSVGVVASTACGSNGDGGSGPNGYEDSVVIRGSGGNYGENFKKALAVWGEENGVSIVWQGALVSENLGRLAAEKNSPQTDLFEADPISIYAGAEQDLFVPLDPAVLENLDTFPPTAVLPGGLAVLPVADAVVIWYHREKMEAAGVTPPSTWEDFQSALTDQRLSERVSLPHIDQGYMRAFIGRFAADPADPTPLLRELADGADQIYDYPATPAAMFDEVTSGQVWLGITGWSRAVDMLNANIGIEVAVPEGSPDASVGFSLVKGAPHPKAAQALLDWLLSDAGQTELAKNTGLSPRTPGAEVDPSLHKNFLTQDQLKNISPWDYESAQKNVDAWRKLWAQYIGSA